MSTPTLLFIKDLLLLIVVLWALWGEFSRRTKDTVLFSLIRMLVGIGGLVLVSKANDPNSKWFLGAIIILLAISVVHSHQKK